MIPDKSLICDPWVPLYQWCDLDQPASPCHQYLSRFVIVQRSELCCQSYHCQITSEYSQNILLDWNWTGIVRLSHCSIPICQLRHLSLIRFIVAKTPKTLFQQIYWASNVHFISFKASGGFSLCKETETYHIPVDQPRTKINWSFIHSKYSGPPRLSTFYSFHHHQFDLNYKNQIICS